MAKSASKKAPASKKSVKPNKAASRPKPVPAKAKKTAKVVKPVKIVKPAKKAPPSPASVKAAKVVKPDARAKPVAAKPIAVKQAPAKPSIPTKLTPQKVVTPSKNVKPLPVKPARQVPPPSFPEPAYDAKLHTSAVATNLKPRKNQAGLVVKELEHFRDLLLEKRRELVGDMSSMEREALRSGGSGSNLSTLPMHMADMGTDNYEQEFTLGLVEKDRNLLREINRALAKIQNGSFGICEGTGKPINKARLEVQPWAKYSIDYARQMERSGMGIRMG